MKSVYELVLEFKQRHPFTIAWRLKQNSSVIERHLNSDERVLYAFVAQKNNNPLIFGELLLLLLQLKEF